MTLVGAGAVADGDLAAALALAPTCVAADSGAETVLAAGVPLEAVIGDMDSISEAARAQIPPERQHRIAEQDSTDFDKALRHILAPLVIAVGFSGRRIDHQLAALHTLVMRPDLPCVMLGAEDIIFLCPRDLHLPMSPGTRVSLFPMGAVTGRSEGLEWPISGLDFAPDGRSGTSNRATGDLTLQIDAPAMLCILPRRFMAEVAEILQAIPVPARWPARAAPHRAPPGS
ncbi:thiamine diphosphokinase [Roseobacter sinensis]|uniref:Thiamine diphosphokinase n=1 Tax=Roseobacter sinensis TaxID=2931391 RepID=A0ABT3BBA7_9RHOB|nr:thiamine diphosphokinase [Roseobacter sp. WL0113]MCV3270398.1 thiamine diphosphokinase [Roseobacter sp. WL0113]